MSINIHSNQCSDCDDSPQTSFVAERLNNTPDFKTITNPEIIRLMNRIVQLESAISKHEHIVRNHLTPAPHMMPYDLELWKVAKEG